jgi:stress response protein YsnF
MSGATLSEEEHEVTLTEERPVVAKETVPVERVRLAKDVEQTKQTVTADVRKERIETDSDVEPNAGTTRRRT